jgi:hypothetical protein
MRLRFLQQGKDLLPLYTGKTFEKVCNGVAGPKMVKSNRNLFGRTDEEIQEWEEPRWFMLQRVRGYRKITEVHYDVHDFIKIGGMAHVGAPFSVAGVSSR